MTRDVPGESRDGPGAALARTSVPGRPRGGSAKRTVLLGAGPALDPGGTRGRAPSGRNPEGEGGPSRNLRRGS